MSGKDKISLFSDHEYRDRIDKTKQYMANAGVDVLLVKEESNMMYLTGYTGLSDYVPQMVILTADEDMPWIILRQMDVTCALYTVYMPEERILGYPESYIGTPDKNGFDFIIDKLKEWRLDNKRLGMEKEILTAGTWEKFLTKLPNVTPVDTTELVTQVRLIKSDQEIQYIKQAARLADLSMRAAIDNAAPGVRECDVAAAMYAAKIRGTAEFGGEVTNVILMPSGEKTSAPHLIWTDKPYQNNTPINIELGGCRNRYVAGLARSIYIGKPPQTLARLHEATRAGMESVFDSLKPGMLCEDAYHIYINAIKKQGYDKASRIGYSIGIDWLETSASLQSGDKTELQPNMTFHLMLGMWDKGWGYNLSETFQITENGCESFAGLARELFIRN